MTTSWKFEATTTKDKNFEILTNFESPWDLVPALLIEYSIIL